LTVTVNGLPAIWVIGVPALPEAVPDAAISPGTTTWSFAKVPATTVKAALEPDASGDMPLVRVAVSRTPVSAFEYLTPEIVTELVPFAMEPVRVPPSVPEPALRLSETAVREVTLAGVPATSCDWTTTLKAAPAVGLCGLIEVIASFAAAPAPAVTLNASVPRKLKLVQPPLPLTVTSRNPTAATVVTVTFAVITVMLLRATPAALTPLPEKVTP
jgi:hypothetical protein